MKKLLSLLFVPQNDYLDASLVDIEKLHLFRVEFLQSILFAVSLVGLGVGALGWLGILPEHPLYTLAVIVHSLLSYLTFLWLKYRKKEVFLLAMHICIFSALLILSFMSAALVHDELRFIWFILLGFVAFILGGKWYGFLITLFVLLIVYVQYFTLNLHISPYALFTFTASFLIFNVFALFFLKVTKYDALTFQTHIGTEIQKRKSKEAVIQKIEASDILNLKEGYLWDCKRKILSHNEHTISLTQKEQRLLALLIERKNSCITFQDIAVHLWDEEYEKEISTASVKVQVTKLRKKLPKACIKNVYGCGYIFHL